VERWREVERGGSKGGRLRKSKCEVSETPHSTSGRAPGTEQGRAGRASTSLQTGLTACFRSLVGTDRHRAMDERMGRLVQYASSLPISTSKVPPTRHPQRDAEIPGSERRERSLHLFVCFCAVCRAVPHCIGARHRVELVRTSLPGGLAEVHS
jgi:hypothetical protein